MSRKLLIDSETLMELVDQLRVAVPQGIAEADEVIRKREDLLNQSLGEARRIRASAENEFRSRMDDTELLKEAHKEAHKIRQEAEMKAQRMLEMAESEAASRRDFRRSVRSRPATQAGRESGKPAEHRPQRHRGARGAAESFRIASFQARLLLTSTTRTVVLCLFSRAV